MGYISTFVLVIMLLQVVANVFARKLFNAPITGTMELVEFSMVITIFWAFAWTATEERHIKVDLVMDHFPKRFQKYSDIFFLILALITYAIITWRMFIESAATVAITSTIHIPKAPFHWIMSIGVGVFTLSIIYVIIKRVTGRKDL
jgi:TRAP-type C4-dicarboxylate transport system permease small subunit